MLCVHPWLWGWPFVLFVAKVVSELVLPIAVYVVFGVRARWDWHRVSSHRARCT